MALRLNIPLSYTTSYMMLTYRTFQQREWKRSSKCAKGLLAGSVCEAGRHLGMPNQDFLNLFEIFGRPAHGGKVAEPGIFQNASYALRTAGAWRVVLDAALVKLPVVPREQEEED